MGESTQTGPSCPCTPHPRGTPDLSFWDTQDSPVHGLGEGCDHVLTGQLQGENTELAARTPRVQPFFPLPHLDLGPSWSPVCCPNTFPVSIFHQGRKEQCPELGITRRSIPGAFEWGRDHPPPQIAAALGPAPHSRGWGRNDSRRGGGTGIRAARTASGTRPAHGSSPSAATAALVGRGPSASSASTAGDTGRGSRAQPKHHSDTQELSRLPKLTLLLGAGQLPEQPAEPGVAPAARARSPPAAPRGQTRLPGDRPGRLGTAGHSPGAEAALPQGLAVVDEGRAGAGLQAAVSLEGLLGQAQHGQLRHLQHPEPPETPRDP